MAESRAIRDRFRPRCSGSGSGHTPWRSVRRSIWPSQWPGEHIQRGEPFPESKALVDRQVSEWWTNGPAIDAEHRHDVLGRCQEAEFAEGLDEIDRLSLLGA